MIRALDLFDATVASLLGSNSNRVREVLRAKEQYLQILLNENEPPEAEASIEKYFAQFAIAARLNR